MGFRDAIRVCLTKKYATFSGRASRSEYWWFYLFALITNIVISLIASNSSAVSVIALVVTLGLLLPIFAVGVRRLHDVGRSGWWFLLGLVPILGGLVLLVWSVSPGTTGNNSYGPDPLSSGAST